MYSFGFLAVILICLGVIAYIVISKFPQLRNLDVNTLPQEKELRKKKEIIDKRLDEQGKQIKIKVVEFLEPVRKFWGKFQLKFRIYVGKIQRLMHHEQELEKSQNPVVLAEEKNAMILTEDKELAVEEKAEEVVKKEDDIKEVKKEIDNSKKVSELVGEAEKLLSSGLFEKAEEKFISAIKLDQKNIPAYRGLADAYFAKGSIEEARETYKFVLQLEPDDDSVMVKMAEIAESQGDIEEAIKYYEQAVLVNDSFAPRFFHLGRLLHQINQDEVAREAVLQAVELDGENPQYLDLLLEIVIILRDSKLASEAYDRLRSVSPENKKLPMYKEKIAVLF